MKMKKIKRVFFIAAGFVCSGYMHARAADTAKIIRKFTLLCNNIRDVRGDYTLAGVISIDDKASPRANMDHVHFLFCKQGGEYYYQLGATVTLNENGAYVYIDNQNKRILVSGQKRLDYDNDIRGFGDLGANIKFEHYKVASKVSGTDETISLTNDHHISCKQYAITFDRRSMKIKQLRLRLSDPRDPLRTDNEKTISVDIRQWTKTAVLSKYLTKGQVIRNVNGQWRTAEMFKQYRLTNM